MKKIREKACFNFYWKLARAPFSENSPFKTETPAPPAVKHFKPAILELRWERIRTGTDNRISQPVSPPFAARNLSPSVQKKKEDKKKKEETRTTTTVCHPFFTLPLAAGHFWPRGPNRNNWRRLRYPLWYSGCNVYRAIRSANGSWSAIIGILSVSWGRFRGERTLPFPLSLSLSISLHDRV